MQEDKFPKYIGMPDNRLAFYSKTIENWLKDKKATILIIGGGEADYKVFRSLGFENVVISNLDSRLKGDEFSPYQWNFQKAEELSYDDAQFDYVVVHAALHHCESPHKALLEMYRVAKIGLIAFESRDSLLMKLLVWMNVTSDYEQLSVYYADCKFGGINNTDIPNYVYRWTEREVEKTISTYAPYARHIFQYQYGSDVPAGVAFEKKNQVKKIIISAIKPLYSLFVMLFPRQQNLFAFSVSKPSIPDDLHDWLKADGESIKFNEEWAKEIYKV